MLLAGVPLFSWAGLKNLGLECFFWAICTKCFCTSLAEVSRLEGLEHLYMRRD